jgi:phosphatidylglycerol:prolipoprotein diacylglycerol transferase
VYPKILDFGGFFLPTYGVLVAAGFLTALWVTGVLAKRAGMDPERVNNIAIYGALAGLLGAKLLMFVVDFDYYAKHPNEILTFATLQAGGVFYGGLMVALATGYYLLKKHSLPVESTLDLYAPGLAIGQAIGRLGCFAAGCCWGNHCLRPWAVTFTNSDAMQVTGVPLNVPMHPTQLYEAFTGLVVFTLVYRAIMRPHAGGSIIGLYLLLSGSARFFVEFFRYHQQPNPFGGPLTTAQAISIGLAGLGVWMLVESRNRMAAKSAV